MSESAPLALEVESDFPPKRPFGYFSHVGKVPPPEAALRKRGGGELLHIPII